MEHANQSQAWLLRILILGILAVGAAVILAEHTQASHFRGGTFYAIPTNQNASEVRFQGQFYWRATAFPGASGGPGSIISDGSFGYPLDPGDGVTSSLRYNINVTVYNSAEDWMGGRLEDVNDGQSGILYQYPGDGTEPYLATWGGFFCCRISSSDSFGNWHINNPDASSTLKTTVDFLESPYNTPPISAFPPVYVCKTNAVCWIEIPNIDADNDKVWMRWSETAESQLPNTNPAICGGCGSSPDAIIHPENQTIEWDTTGATYHPDCPSSRSYYSTQVMLTDNESNSPTAHVPDDPALMPHHHQVPVDFLIELCETVPDAPYWNPKSACGTTKIALAGTVITFDVIAQSDNPARLITLYELGLPYGASSPLPAPSNPAKSTFTWTPTKEGSFLVVYGGYDDQGMPLKPCAVRIKVILQPQVEFSWIFTTTSPYNYTIDPVQFHDDTVYPAALATYKRTWLWEFYDLSGNVLGTSNLQNPQFNYPHAGVYKVCFTSTQTRGSDVRTASICHDVPVNNRPPTAAFTQLIDNEQRTVALYDASNDRDGTVVKWSWTMDPLASVTSWTGPDPPVLTFPTKGHYQVTLRVEDDLGAVDATTQDILVGNLPPVVHAIPDLEVPAGESITIPVYAEDRDLDPLTYSVQRNPREMQLTVHEDNSVDLTWQTTASDVGDYAGITVTATDTAGATGQWAFKIKVFDPATDTDLDGVADVADNCPTVANHDQSDSDGDNVGDLCEGLPQAELHAGSQGSSTDATTVTPTGPDSDGDGVADALDLCPGTKDTAAQSDLDGDRIGDACDADIDGDGVLNTATDKRIALDNCPTVANPDQKDANHDGKGDACDPLTMKGNSGSLNGNSQNGADGNPVPESKGVLASMPRAAGLGLLALAAIAVGLVATLVAVRKLK